MAGSEDVLSTLGMLQFAIRVLVIVLILGVVIAAYWRWHRRR
jgi:hypothetical protein